MTSELDYWFPARSGLRDFPHLLVVLPGIGGSELRSGDGRLLWGLEPGVLRRPARRPQELAARDEDLADPAYDDQVRATGLLAIPVPGLTRMFGNYRPLRDALRTKFDLDADLNYLEFPYDWRRPLSRSAALLAETIAQRLRRLRERRPGAKVVIVAHSMGGLVARRYVAEHDRDGDCDRILTLGTPFRGAVKALNYLVNGPSLGPVRLRPVAEFLGRLPSVYELLPMYRIVAVPGAEEPRYVADVLDELPMLDRARTLASRELLRSINGDCARPWITQPTVGHGAPTPQQALLAGGRLTVSTGSGLLPAGYPAEGGDGTVPLAAARPPGHRSVIGYANQSHSGLATHPASLGALVLALRDVLDSLEAHDPVLGHGDEPPPAHDPGVPRGRPVLEVDVPDVHDSAEPLVISGTIHGGAPGTPLHATLTDGPPRSVVIGDDGRFRFDFGLREPGLHRLSLSDSSGGGSRYDDVTELV